MTVLACCVLATLLSHWLGVRWPGRGYGMPKGWLMATGCGLLIGLSFWAFSIYGLLANIDSF